MNWLEKLKINGKYVAMGNVIINKTIGKINHPLVAVFGFILLLVVIFFNFFIPCPSRSQYIFLRIGFSIGITLALIPLLGKLKIGKHSFKGLSILLLLFLTYLVNPAAVVSKDNCGHYSHLNGKIFIGDKPLQEAVISIPQYDYKTLSNSSGEFWIHWKNEKSDSDSIFINVSSEQIDTSFYWKRESGSLLISIADTLIPISKEIIRKLFVSRINDFEKLMQGKFIEWEVNTENNIQELFTLYSSFEAFEANYRNEFKFKGLEHEISFRKNLLSAGIQVADQLKPFDKHSFDSCKTYILRSTEFPEYELNYLLKNEKNIEFEINKLQFISEDRYKARISFKENIRNIRVLLNCSKKTNGYKVRQMEVYGFLPEEEFDVKFKHGKWFLTKTKNV
jgi:hypothetical protein